MTRTVKAGAVALIALGALSPMPAQADTRDLAPTCDNICVLDARAGAHVDFDRVVFDLTGGQPLIQAAESNSGSYGLPSGETSTLQISGKSYLFLDLQGADAFDVSGNRTYANPDVQSIDLSSIKGVQRIPDAEGQVHFGLTLGDHSKCNVSTLTAPDRIVVDVYH
ncbi:hypothetical protein AB0J38_11520 [Streptomyces sp. NPDC050095]|uniref:AMIN-like domain-containing (lipo)protein n=1 Tax=unclassified Streptomyces TaxID=2593676 RepID=UPI00342037B5